MKLWKNVGIQCPYSKVHSFKMIERVPQHRAILRELGESETRAPENEKDSLRLHH